MKLSKRQLREMILQQMSGVMPLLEQGGYSGIAAVLPDLSPPAGILRTAQGAFPGIAAAIRKSYDLGVRPVSRRPAVSWSAFLAEALGGAYLMYWNDSNLQQAQAIGQTLAFHEEVQHALGMIAWDVYRETSSTQYYCPQISRRGRYRCESIEGQTGSDEEELASSAQVSRGRRSSLREGRTPRPCPEGKRPARDVTRVICPDEKIEVEGGGPRCWPGWRAVVLDVLNQGGTIYLGKLKTIWDRHTSDTAIAGWEAGWPPIEASTDWSVVTPNEPQSFRDIRHIWTPELKQAARGFFDDFLQALTGDLGFSMDFDHPIFEKYNLAYPGDWAPGCTEVPGYAKGQLIPRRIPIEDVGEYEPGSVMGEPLLLNPAEQTAQWFEEECPTAIEWSGSRVYYDFEDWRTDDDCSWRVRNHVVLSDSEGSEYINDIQFAAESAIDDGIFQGVQITVSPEARTGDEDVSDQVLSGPMRSSQWGDSSLITFRNDLVGDFEARGLPWQRVLGRMQQGINRFKLTVFINRGMPIISSATMTRDPFSVWLERMEAIPLGTNEVGQWGAHTTAIGIATMEAVRAANRDLENGVHSGLFPVFIDPSETEAFTIRSSEQGTPRTIDAGRATGEAEGVFTGYSIPINAQYRVLGTNFDPNADPQPGPAVYVALTASTEPSSGSQQDYTSEEEFEAEYQTLQEARRRMLIEQNQDTNARLGFEEMKDAVLDAIESVPGVTPDYEFMDVTGQTAGVMTPQWISENWDLENILRKNSPTLWIWVRLEEAEVIDVEPEAEEEIEAAMGTYG